MKQISAFFGGQSVMGDGPDIPVFNPSTGSQIAVLPETGASQVADAVTAAYDCFTSGVWSDASLADRQGVLRSAAQNIRANADELIALQVAEGGMTQGAVRVQVMAAAGWFDYYADFLTTVAGETYGQLSGTTTLVERIPVGVCALYSPWNVPVTLSAIKMAPALAAGNAVVLKPSEETPMVTRRLIDLVVAAGLPDGLLNLVNGRGAVTGATLADDPRVAMISFTGGPAGGRAVAEAAARRHIPCVMELGGKSATVVFADADLDEAVEGALLSIYLANGEACLAGSRILVQDTIADAFIQRFVARAKALRVGDAADAETFCGPMISAKHRASVLGFYEQAAADGDEILFGGPVQDRDAGFYVMPGAIRIASRDSRVWREEVFGPLAAFTTFADEAEAVALANDTAFGLSGYLWTNDLGRAHRVAKQLRTGTVVINSTFMRDLNAPFGGFKHSGHGREGGVHSWQNFTQARTTIIKHG